MVYDIPNYLLKRKATEIEVSWLEAAGFEWSGSNDGNGFYAQKGVDCHLVILYEGIAFEVQKGNYTIPVEESLKDYLAGVPKLPVL